jgi:hypothetical protein
MITFLRSSKTRAFVKGVILLGAAPALVWVNQKIVWDDLRADFIQSNAFMVWEGVLGTLQKTAFVAAGLVVSGFQLRTRIVDVLQKDYFDSSQLVKLESLVIGCTKRLSAIMVRLVLTAAFMALGPLIAEATGLGLVTASVGTIALIWAGVDFLAILSSFDQLEDFTLEAIKRFKREQETDKINKALKETKDTEVAETRFSGTAPITKRKGTR